MDNNSSSNPLVSIIVITYNSSKFVLDTLESAKRQTYKNIELIISDDHSTDDTVAVCQQWLSENETRFVRATLVKTDINTGITGNCNRGVRSANGEWIKMIAGDDFFLDTCIEHLVVKIVANPNIGILFSNIQINGVDEVAESFRSAFYMLEADQQYRFLLRGNFLYAPAALIKHSILVSLGLFDERYPMIEDYPFFLKALLNNHKLYYIDECLVNYRVHNDNISKNGLVNKRYNASLIAFFKSEYLRSLWNERMYFYCIHYSFELLLMYLVDKSIIQRWSAYKRILYWFTPMYNLKRLKRIMRIA